MLATVLVALTALTAGGSIAQPEVYQEAASGHQFSDTYWHANDLVTLFGAVPLALAALHAARRGSRRAELLWLGTVCYVLYTYLFYVFGATLNRLYPAYLVLVVLSGALLVQALKDLAGRGPATWNLAGRGPATWIDAAGRSVAGEPGADPADAGVRRLRRPPADLVVVCMTMALFAVIVAVTWTTEWADLVGSGQWDTPAAEFVRTVAAVDIPFLTVGMLLAAVQLWQGRRWGYPLAVVLNVSTALYMGVLALAAWGNGRAGVPGAAAEVPTWVTLLVVCLAVSLWLLRRPKSR